MSNLFSANFQNIEGCEKGFVNRVAETAISRRQIRAGFLDIHRVNLLVADRGTLTTEFFPSGGPVGPDGKEQAASHLAPTSGS